MNFITLGIALFVLAQVGIGYWASKRISSEADFVVAGRRLGPWLCSISIFATWFGAESVMGSSAAIAEDGLSRGRADPMGYAVCLLLLGFIVARKIRQSGAITLADFFRKRYGKYAERVATIVLIPPALMWGGAQIRAFAQILDFQSELLTINVAIVLATGLVITYTVLGGLLGDVITDVMQAGVILIGLIILLVAIMMELGGPVAAVNRIEMSQLSLIGEGETFLSRLDMWLVPIIGSLVVQETISRVLACRTDRVAQQGALMGGGMYLVFGLIPVMIGLLGAHLGLQYSATEEFIPVAAQTYLHGIVYIIFIGALVSIILSTSDSTLLAIGALTAHNLVFSWNRNLTDSARLLCTRIVIVIAGIACAVIALGSKKIYDLVLMADGFGTAGIATVGVAGLWLRMGGGAAAISTLLVGVAVSVTGRFVLELQAPFLLSLGCSVTTFFTVCAIEKAMNRSNVDAPPRRDELNDPEQ